VCEAVCVAGCFPTSSVLWFRDAATIPATTSIAAPATRIPAGERGNRGVKDGARMCAGGISGPDSADGRTADFINGNGAAWRAGSNALVGAAKVCPVRADGFACTTPSAGGAVVALGAIAQATA